MKSGFVFPPDLQANPFFCRIQDDIRLDYIPAHETTRVARFKTIEFSSDVSAETIVLPAVAEGLITYSRMSDGREVVHAYLKQMPFFGSFDSLEEAVENIRMSYVLMIAGGLLGGTSRPQWCWRNRILTGLHYGFWKRIGPIATLFGKELFRIELSIRN